MPPAPRVPTGLRDDPFLGSLAVAAGLLSRRQLSGNSWRRLFHDVYVHAGVPITHELRARAASTLLPRAVVTGASAAVLWGVDLVQAEDDVEVTLPPGSHLVRVEGIRARRARLHEEDVWRRRGIPVTMPAPTALRLAAALPPDDAVVAVDQLIATGVVELTEIRALAATRRGPGSARARTVSALADGLAGSPQETRLRLLIGRSPLPPPTAQFRVRHRNRFVAQVDFGWPEHQVALEYDGLWHAEDGQFARDRERLNRLREAGWQVVFVTAADLRRPGALLRRIAAALGITL